MRYYKFPKWLKRFYPDAIWDFSFKETDQKVIYLTFDDGPHPDTTPWLLSELAQFNAQATFFCIGQNVAKHPELYQQLLSQQHGVGNHTHQHVNSLFTSTQTLINDVEKAQKLINSDLFRPPYGKLKPKQHHALKSSGFRTVFWSHISYDFDATLNSSTRIKNTLKHTKNGAIVVFHDSVKAFPQLKKELPILLEKWQAEGYSFKAIT